MLLFLSKRTAQGTAFLLVLAFVAGDLRAELRWKSTEQEVSAKVTDSEASVQFEYVNDGKTPIAIERIMTSCGCTTATSTGQVIAPGQAGEINAKISLGSALGSLRGNALVQTDDGSKTVLVFTVKIPQVLVIDPKVIVWNDSQEEQVLKVRVVGVDAVEITRATGPIGVEIDVVPVKVGSEYEVRIRAPRERRARSGNLRLETSLKAGATPKVVEVLQRSE